MAPGLEGTQIIRYAFPAFRVFVYGFNVTRDVELVSINWSLGNAPSSCSITLLSPRDKYILNMNDIRALRGNSFLDEQAFRQSLSLAAPPTLAQAALARIRVGGGVKSIVAGGVGDPTAIKSQIVASKLNEPVPLVDVLDLQAKNVGQVRVRKHEFVQGRPVFHAGDPVRVAFRHPYQPSRWFWMFTGFVEDVGDTFDEDHGQIVTLSCADVTRIFKYARWATNPGITDASRVIASRDEANRRWTAPLAGYSLPEAVVATVFGTAQADIESLMVPKVGKDGEKTYRQPIDGVGNFSKDGSRILFYGGRESSTTPILDVAVENGITLEQYHKLIDHEVYVTDLRTMLRSGAYVKLFDGRPAPSWEEHRSQEARNATVQANIDAAESGDVAITDVIDVIGSDVYNYPVDNGRLLMLLPDSFGAQVFSAADKDFSQTVGMTTEFTNRLRLLYEAASRFDFYFYASPKGDLLLEFPLYDFDPDDFGEAQQDRFILRPYDVVNDGGQLSDAKIRTQFSVKPRYVKDFKGTGQDVKPVVVTLPAMVAQYGWRMEGGDPHGYITSEEGARLFATVQLNKINADAYTMNVQVTPHFEAWPNRPFLIKRRNHMGLCLAVKHAISWTSMDVSTSLDFGYSRGWAGHVDDDGKLMYVPIGGEVSKPLNYKLLGQPRPVPPVETTQNDEHYITWQREYNRTPKGKKGKK
jgi:hypothetical protein